MVYSIKSVMSTRKFNKWASWQPVYEWEDELATELEVPVELKQKNYLNGLWYRIIKVFPKFKKLFFYRWTKTELSLSFVMNSSSYWEYNLKNVVPIFIDTPLESIDALYHSTKKIRFFWVTCFDFYLALKKKYPDSGIQYMPLSVASKYLDLDIRDKCVDILQFGRRNDLLHKYALRYCEEHPNVEYIYQNTPGSLEYTSTVSGSVGKYTTREEYINLLAKAKISLVSTPCIDGGRNFGGIDFFTARFFESAICNCKMVGRYTKNDEAKLLNIGKVCEFVESYDDFEKSIDKILSTYDIVGISKEHHDFIEQNVTKRRALLIRKILKEEV